MTLDVHELVAQRLGITVAEARAMFRDGAKRAQ